jgi:CRP-like cAMP-binding protein
MGGYGMPHEPIEFRINKEKLMRDRDHAVKTRTPTNDCQPDGLRPEERLFLSLLDTPLLSTTGFLQNKVLIQPGEPFQIAYVIVSGEVLIKHEERTYKLGAGAVFGLSEGIVGMTSKYSATTNTFVEMKIIHFHKVVSIIKALPLELQAIILTIVKRNLQFYEK